MTSKTERLGKKIRDAVVDYHLEADQALMGKVRHYPSIVEVETKILKACKKSGLRFVDIPTGYIHKGIEEIEV